MRGESILVVDDEPVNLKLADIVLRKAGYQVHVVHTAEEALGVLRSMVPKMMLVDIQLPGIDGIELAKRVRKDPRTSGIVVVALTACAMKSDEERAMAAGFDGYITKPINTQTLARRVREYMERSAGAKPADPPPPEMPAPALPGGLELSGLELESIRRRFLEEGALQSRQLLIDLDQRFDVAKAAALVHRWIGAAGALGYVDITAHSCIIEDLLAAASVNPRDLRESLTELVLAFADPAEAALDPLPEFVIAAIAEKRILLVGFAIEEAERLCNVFEELGARPRLVEADEPCDSDAIKLCQIVMVHVRPETRGTCWLNPAAEINSTAPIIFVGNRELIMALAPAVQARAREFLIDGWQPEEAMMRLAFAIRQKGHGTQSAAPLSTSPTRLGQTSARVLIAEDDATVRAVVQRILLDHGVECRAVGRGEDAIRALSEYEPTAAILDVNMPSMSGFEVLAAIRARNLPVRVVMLTARRQEQDIIQGFNLGADDYIVKPFSPLELVVRLKRLL